MISSIRFAVLSACVGMAMMTSSCDEISKASQIGVPITVSFAIDAEGAISPTEDVSCTDLSENKDFNDNKDKVVGGSVKQAYVRLGMVSNPRFSDPSITLDNAVLQSVRYVLVFDERYGDKREYEIASASNVPLRQLMTTSPTEKGYLLPASSGTINDAVKLIARRPKFCVRSIYGPLVGGGTVAADRIEGSLDVTFEFKVETL